MSSIQKIKCLPGYLENYIYQNRKGYYNPNHQRARYNLDANEEEIKRNIGTYFPRSFIEIFNILENLFKNSKIHESFERKTNITLLDIGSGTGGSSLGALHFFNNTKSLSNKRVKLVSIDGNEIALRYQKEIIDYYFKNNSKSLMPDLETVPYIFDENNFEHQIKEQLENRQETFDLIICSKFLNELVEKNSDEKYYYHLMTGIYGQLANESLLIISDLTIQLRTNDHKEKLHLPIKINKELSNYFCHTAQQKSFQLKQLIPMSCALWRDHCKSQNDCFIQNIINCNSPHSKGYKSKVAYFVFAPQVFANSILSVVKKKERYYNNAQKKSLACSQGLLVSTPASTKCLDGFQLE